MEIKNPEFVQSIDRSTINGLLLYDRIIKITQIVEQYGEKNFCMSYSGGKDSNVMHALFDMALPDNKIPRVYCDTGIELNAVRDFVRTKAQGDDRFVIIRPQVPIKKMLEAVGYPFKSKLHARAVREWHHSTSRKHAERYYNGDIGSKIKCPKLLKYQFEQDLTYEISEKCCDELKKKPYKRYKKANGYKYDIIGIMAAEGGQRNAAKCLAFSGDNLKAFQPLAPLTKNWEDWFIAEYNISLPIVYYSPYNFERTGCKGCPFNRNLQHELDVLKIFFPNERKQCEYIWKPVYEEYRRIGYRLKAEDGQLTFDDIK